MEELFRSMAKRGKQANLSFFAFTATPKHKTLAVFGRDGWPAHRYTMRQAIEEEFILDVLKHYTTGSISHSCTRCSWNKRLAGIQAVQTLSRLNRTHPFKEDTFVLDFVNDWEEIREAFKAYYEGAEMGEEVDPALMYAIKDELDASGIYLDEEVDRFSAVYFKPKQRQSAMDHQAMNAALDPEVSRFAVRQNDDEEEAEL